MTNITKIHLSPKIKRRMSSIDTIDVVIKKKLFRKAQVIVYIGVERFII